MKTLHHVVNFILFFGVLLLLGVLALFQLANLGILTIIYLTFMIAFALYLNNYNDKN